MLSAPYIPLPSSQPNTPFDSTLVCATGGKAVVVFAEVDPRAVLADTWFLTSNRRRYLPDMEMPKHTSVSTCVLSFLVACLRILKFDIG